VFAENNPVTLAPPLVDEPGMNPGTESLGKFRLGAGVLVYFQNDLGVK